MLYVVIVSKRPPVINCDLMQCTTRTLQGTTRTSQGTRLCVCCRRCGIRSVWREQFEAHAVIRCCDNRVHFILILVHVIVTTVRCWCHVTTVRCSNVIWRWSPYIERNLATVPPLHTRFKTGGRVDKFITTVTVHTATRWHHCLVRVSLSERQRSACVTAAIAIVNINNIDGSIQVRQTDWSQVRARDAGCGITWQWRILAIRVSRAVMMDHRFRWHEHAVVLLLLVFFGHTVFYLPLGKGVRHRLQIEVILQNKYYDLWILL